MTKKNKPVKRFLTDDEWLLVKEVMPNNYVRLIFALLHGTGLRIQELLYLQKRDITFKNNKGKIYVSNGKGNKSRYVPIIYDEVTKKLEDYVKKNNFKSEDLLFLNRLGRPYKSGCSLNKTLKHYCKVAGITNY